MSQPGFFDENNGLSFPSHLVDSLFNDENWEFTHILEKDSFISSDEPMNNNIFQVEKVKFKLQDNGSYNVIPANSDLDSDQGISSIMPSVPSNTNYPGPYNFEISFESPSSISSKGTISIYSEIAKKLYVQPFKTFPIRFRCSSPPPPQCYIRAMPIFMQAEHIRDVVKRCPNHTNEIRYNEHHHYPEHLIRCENNAAEYLVDQHTGRQTVIVPYEPPQPGTTYATYLFQFMCFTSCVGGLNRRPIQVIFTLEQNNNVLGRCVVEVRMCACPTRDRKTDEKTKCPQQYPSPKRGNKIQHATEILTVAPINKRLKTEEVFTMTVTGRENYELLLRIKEKLEMADVVYRNTPPSSSPPSFTRVGSFSNNILTNSQSFQIGTSVPSSPLQEPTSSQENNCSLLQISKNEPSPNSHVTSSQPDKSISAWLDKIGLKIYADVFHEKHLCTMDQLEDFTKESLTSMKIFEAHQNKIWQALQEYKQNGPSCFIFPSSLPNSGSSTASAWSQGSSRPEGIEITRYTFKHVITVKETKDAET